ncbi:MAG: hypothetical protein HQL60_03970 [Magnetococcales bacterium]|nr:hypothetical protein [Magnetococcales bacterium]
MADLNFQVMDTQNKVFDVIVSKNGKNMTAICSCSAGVNDICQHRINILSGSAKGVVSKNSGEVKTVTSWIAGTDVGKALHDVLECAKRLENATEDFGSARKRLIKALRD